LQQINKMKKINSTKKIHMKKMKLQLLKIGLIWKKNLTTTFIQLLRTKTIKNKIKNKYSEKIMKKEEEKNLTLM
jgi:hypothetical protein